MNRSALVRSRWTCVLRLSLFVVWVSACIAPASAQIVVDQPKPDNRAGLTARGIPREGNDVLFEFAGEPGETALLILGGVQRDTPIPPFGLLCIDPQHIWDSTAFGSSNSIKTVLPTAVPGALLIAQALGIKSGLPTQFSNTVRIYIMGGRGSRFVLELDPYPDTTTEPDVEYTGTAAASGSIIRVEGGASVQTVTANQGANADEFKVRVPLKADKRNRLFFSETTPGGQQLPPVTAETVQDDSGPDVFIDFPADGTEITAPVATIAGRIADRLSGFAPMTVKANGIDGIVYPGIGTNGSYEVRNVPLNPIGQTTTITVTGEDVHGNPTSETITLEQIALSGVRMKPVRGDGQSGSIHSVLPTPVEVLVTRPDGTPFCRKTVTFTVTRSDGRIGASEQTTTETVFQQETDDFGIARCYWKLGSDAGCGNNRIEVTSKDVSGFVAFCSSANPAPAKQINIGSGNDQCAQVWSPVPELLRAWVSDGCNPTVGAAVLFEIVEGDGTVAVPGQAASGAVTAITGPSGHAEVQWTLGGLVGPQRVRASLLNVNSVPVVFQARGAPPAASTHASWSGCVLDNAELPIEGATARLEIAGQVYTAATNESGAFTIPGIVESGPGDLYIEGETATKLNGKRLSGIRFPHLHYEVLVVAGIDNFLPRPVSLPALQSSNDRLYYRSSGAELECDGIDGLRMVIAPNSMWMPGQRGKVPAPDRTVVALNKVDVDRVPMPMNDGAAPPFAWTLQPSGYEFDPPVQIFYPNMSGLPSGAIAYFLSFDHDTGRFEIVSSAHVSADGSEIVSDPGDGISVAGWGCNCPPYSVAQDCDFCKTKKYEGTILGGQTSAEPSYPKLGESVVFKMTEAVDLGGRIWKKCKGKPTQVTIIPGVTPSYGWVVRDPNGNRIASGPGRETPPIRIAECGTYECEFSISVARACAPKPKKKVESVAAGISSKTYSVTIREPGSIYQMLADWLNAIPGLSFKFKGRETLVKLGVTERMICCKGGDPKVWRSVNVDGPSGKKFGPKDPYEFYRIFIVPLPFPPFFLPVTVGVEIDWNATVGQLGGNATYDGCVNKVGAGGSVSGSGSATATIFASVTGSGIEVHGGATSSISGVGTIYNAGALIKLVADGSWSGLDPVVKLCYDPPIPWLKQVCISHKFDISEGSKWGPAHWDLFDISKLVDPGQ